MSEKLEHSHVLYFSIDLFVLLIFFILNKKYENENNNGKDYIKILNGSVLSGKDNNIKNLLLKKLNFKENEDIYRLFKNMFIKKNLIAKDCEDLKLVFLKFIPESFINEVGNRGINRISPGLSVKKYLNVMFLDIIGFTAITEKMTPNNALLLLNIYFDGIVEIIKDNGGFIDKFLGDGIMIIFDGKKSDSAILAAIEIQNLMNKFHVSGNGKKISVGIGINSGDVILGTVGSDKRMEITIIGDVVNTASRIEGLTRTCKNNIIISDATYRGIENLNKFSINDLGFKTLRGKKNEIKIFGINPVINSKS